LMEREAANREKGGKERGNVSSRARWMVWRPPCAIGCMSNNRSITHHAEYALAQITLPHRPMCILCRVLTQHQTCTSIKPTLIPSTQTDCDGVIDYCITSTKLPPYFGSPLAPPSPGPAPLSTTAVFRALATATAPPRSSSSPEIAGCIHAMWQDLAILQMLGHSLVLVPGWWEYITSEIVHYSRWGSS
jgi:hypothetical protein